MITVRCVVAPTHNHPLTSPHPSASIHPHSHARTYHAHAPTTHTATPQRLYTLTSTAHSPRHQPTRLHVSKPPPTHPTTQTHRPQPRLTPGCGSVFRARVPRADDMHGLFPRPRTDALRAKGQGAPRLIHPPTHHLFLLVLALPLRTQQRTRPGSGAPHRSASGGRDPHSPPPY